MDEASIERSATLIREIIEISQQYHLNKFVISCRVASYNYWFEQFTNVEIADFNDGQIQTFIANWFSEDNSAARTTQCSNAILTNIQIKELAATPLLLAMLCLAYEEGVELSVSRTQLYQDALDALLQKWDGMRQIRRDDTYRQMTVQQKRALLSYVAAVTFEAGEYFFTGERLEKIIGEFIQNLPSVNIENLAEDAHAICEAIESHHGLLLERAAGVHSFSHLTFQEYFTANYVRGKAESQVNLIKSFVGTRRWSEVVVSVACLLLEADDYVLAILERMEDFGVSGRYLPPLRSYLHRIKSQPSKMGGEFGEKVSTGGPFLYVVEGGAPETVGSAREIIESRKMNMIRDLDVRIFFQRTCEFHVGEISRRVKEVLRLEVTEGKLELKKLQNLKDLIKGVEMSGDFERRLTRIVMAKMTTLFANGENNYDTYASEWISEISDGVSTSVNFLIDFNAIHEIVGKEYVKLRDNLRSALNDAIEYAYSLESDRFRPIVGAEALLEIHQSIAYMHKFTRETIIKTLHTMRRPGGDDPEPETNAVRA